MPAYGDLVILQSPRGKRYLRRVEEGNDLHCQEGVLPMADLAAAEYGTEIRTRQGVPFRVQRPTITDLVKGVKRQTQIIYPRTSPTSACALAWVRAAPSSRRAPVPAA